ncbi:peptide chain release factor N(5)-glutamine methyltransferase [Solimonas terrae]|uniref:Release factor glutamine methyltransferase n=2 Tax=Solimonas terrae TaxID=1396819 RepID=A0A6M2BQN9_9GAMM|nr:peptide chain release factor N(5)-glutamine methyltransferase [Solimonas terrae]NGY04389.1 peptide chain release factor N(5)-glutamine methyltransferase [Solimonas terrae]
MQTQAAVAAVSDSARLDAELLLGHVLGLSRTQLRLRHDQALDETRGLRLATLTERRCGGEPIAYLLGAQGFWSLDLEVNAAVLVPRPETELLVEWALERLPVGETRRVVDLGTGSGAIALAIAVERPQVQISASDISADALAVACRNAARVAASVDFHEGRWWQPFAAARFDLVVSNPPYIAAGDPHLAALGHEPALALSDGADGLQALCEIIAGAPAQLRPNGWLLLEHGHDQGAAVRALLSAAGFDSVSTRRDLEARERVSGGRWR